MFFRSVPFICIIVLFVSCQKDPDSANNGNNQITSQVDSMRYTYRDEDLNKKAITSLYVFTYGSVNGENAITKIKRIDTMFGPTFNTANYVDKDYTYDNTGRLINIHSKSRRLDLINLATIIGNGSIENYNVRYDYSVPNDYAFPSSITIDIYTDSSASSVFMHDSYTSVSSFNGYFGPDHIDYYLGYNKDSILFSDAHNILWGGPALYPTGNTNHSDYLFVFNQNGQVKDFIAYQTPYYFEDYERQDQRRVHFQHDSNLVKLMGLFIGRKTLKYTIASEITLDKYKELSNQDPFRGIVNELNNLSLSSTDSTIKLDNKGKITEVIEKINSNGTLELDAQGRVSTLVKHITKTRSRQPTGTFNTTQTFQFFYKK